MINHEILQEIKAIAAILQAAQANADYSLDQLQYLSSTEEIIKRQLLLVQERVELLIKRIDS